MGSCILHSDKMSLITILVCLGTIGSAVGTRQARDTCSDARREFNACKKQAYETYTQNFVRGDDGRKPDFMARKSCNFLTDSVEECTTILIGTCHTEEEVVQDKDKQMKEALKQVNDFVPNWDSQKCPAAKAHLDRMNAAEVRKRAKEEYVHQQTTSLESKASTTTVSCIFVFCLAYIVKTLH